MTVHVFMRIYMCVCVCLWMSLHVYECLCVFMRMDVYQCSCVYVCLYVYTCVWLFKSVYECLCVLCMRVYPCVKIYMCACLLMYVHLYMYMHECVFVFMYAYMYERVCEFNLMYVYVYQYECVNMDASMCSWAYEGILIYDSVYIYIYIYHIVPLARISLTLSRHFSLSFIVSGRSSGLHPVSSHSCCMYVRAGRPAFARPYVGLHWSTSLMSSSLLLQQCPACLGRLTWIGDGNCFCEVPSASFLCQLEAVFSSLSIDVLSTYIYIYIYIIRVLVVTKSHCEYVSN